MSLCEQERDRLALHLCLQTHNEILFHCYISMLDKKKEAFSTNFTIMMLYNTLQTLRHDLAV